MTPHITVGEAVQKTIPDYRHTVHSARLCCLEHAAPRGLTAHRWQPCSTPGWQEQWTWGLVDHRKMLYMILVALCKTVVSPVLMHWRYYSPALRHQIQYGHVKTSIFSKYSQEMATHHIWPTVHIWAWFHSWPTEQGMGWLLSMVCSTILIKASYWILWLLNTKWYTII